MAVCCYLSLPSQSLLSSFASKGRLMPYSSLLGKLRDPPIRNISSNSSSSCPSSGNGSGTGRCRGRGRGDCGDSGETAVNGS